MTGIIILKVKTCCVTGHRESEISKITDIKKAIKKHVLQAINDGYKHFICGFAEGVDLYFAEIVAELKSKYNITLEAAIPYPNRMNSKNIAFQQLIKHCYIVRIHTEEYIHSCFMQRNRFMVQASELVIALYDGREKGGTFFTMRYAHALQKEVQIINIFSIT